MSDPLCNYEAEAELLGSLMNDNGLIDRAADIVRDSDFAEPVHGRIYSAMVREFSRGKTANPVTLRGYFEGDETLNPLGGVTYLMKLTGAAMGFGGIEVARQIADLAHRRRMRAGLATAAQACADLDSTMAEIVSHADQALGSTSDGIAQLSIAECIAEHLASLDDKTHGVRCQVIQPLDDLLGPMKPKQLIIGAGRPGMGKTTVALSYALGAAEAGHGVLFVSLEMSGGELGAKVLSDLCFDSHPVPFKAIRDGDLYPNQRTEILKAQAKAMQLPITVVDTGALSIGRLNMLVRRHARRMQANGYKLELVVVDYLQLLQPDSKGRSQYEAVSEISRGLKAMAKDNGVAIFALAQLSRSVESRNDKRPILSDLRDSGQIEQDADAVLFLLRQEYYLAQKAPEERDPDWQIAMEAAQGRIEFILAKRRNGVTGSAEGLFHGQYQAVRG
jgi:replicative DNA helicase